MGAIVELRGVTKTFYRGKEAVPVLENLPRLKALVMWNSRTAGCDLQLSAPAARRRVGEVELADGGVRHEEHQPVFGRYVTVERHRGDAEVSRDSTH